MAEQRVGFRNEWNGADQIDVKSLGALLISDIVARTAPDNPIRVTRRAQHIRKDGRDDFMLWLTLEGTATLAQNDRAALMRPGDLILHDQTQPFVLEFSENHRCIMITIPRPLLIARLPTARRCVARRIAAGNANRRTGGIGDRTSQPHGNPCRN